VAYRVKSNFYAVCGSGLFFRIAQIYRRGRKELQKVFSSSLLCQFSVEKITTRMSCYQNTLLQTIHSVII